MKPIVVDALERISLLGNSGSTRELAEVAGNVQNSGELGLDALEELLGSLPLNTEEADKLRDLAADIFANGEASGFRRGFRVGARLMLECLGEPERGGTHEPECD